MAHGQVHVDLEAIAANWCALDGLSANHTQTAAVVKADAYGLGVARIAPTLAKAGARHFFVASASEAFQLRQVLGAGPRIYNFGGLAGLAEPGIINLQAADIIPILTTHEECQIAAVHNLAVALHLETGINRAGIQQTDWPAAQALIPSPVFIMSHLACADDPPHAMNHKQREMFAYARKIFPGVPASLAATGGVLLGADFHYDLTRPGIGLYGGAPFLAAQPVIRFSLPVLQIRTLTIGECVGYGANYTAKTPCRIAVLGGGYADGIPRALSGRSLAVHDAFGNPAPIIGRVSMDMITVDISHIQAPYPDSFDLIGPYQSIDSVAETAGTIGYEILTRLSQRNQIVYS